MLLLILWGLRYDSAKGVVSYWAVSVGGKILFEQMKEAI